MTIVISNVMMPYSQCQHRAVELEAAGRYRSVLSRAVVLYGAVHLTRICPVVTSDLAPFNATIVTAIDSLHMDIQQLSYL